MRQEVRRAGMLLLFIGLSFFSIAQGILGKTISVDIQRQPLSDALKIISNKGDFYFSYSSYVVKRDSLVSLSVQQKPIREILALLFDNTYEFRETGNYIIIRKAPIKLTFITNKAVKEERIYSVTGYVYDDASGVAINEASVYEKKLLSATLTNPDGFFKLRLKSGKQSTAELTVSKEFYEDTTVIIEPRHSQQLTITMMPFERPGENIVVSPEDYLSIDSVEPDLPIPDTSRIFQTASTDTNKVERTRMGKFLLSAKQKAQTVNLRNFFTSRPFQISLTPGLSTHGLLGSQVINNFSFNVFGGYTAGTNGFELGGLFNIDKKDVRYVQIGGLFNAVGGQVEGVQIGGLNNTVLDTVSGVQLAGVNNFVRGRFRGWQIAGVYNHVTDSVRGLQLAGVANFAKKKVSGVQLSGVINFSNRETDGVQISGVFNYTKRLRGVQIGLINIADTSDGYSIGLINIILKGYHKLSFFANELTDVNAAFKTGNRKLYSVLLAGLNTDKQNKAYTFGYGLGTELMLNKRKSLSLNPELTSQLVYLGSWDQSNILNKFQFHLNIHIAKWFSLFGGPTFNYYLADQKVKVDGYMAPTAPAGYKSFNLGSGNIGWFGWNAGISFF